MERNIDYYRSEIAPGSMLRLRVYDWWFQQIKDGVKKVEYRELGVKWSLRLIANLNVQYYENKLTGIVIPEDVMFHRIQTVCFKNCNNVYDDSLFYEIEKIDIGSGKIEWGAKPNQLYFRIHLLEVVV